MFETELMQYVESVPGWVWGILGSVVGIPVFTKICAKVKAAAFTSDARTQINNEVLKDLKFARKNPSKVSFVEKPVTQNERVPAHTVCTLTMPNYVLTYESNGVYCTEANNLAVVNRRHGNQSNVTAMLKDKHLGNIKKTVITTGKAINDYVAENDASRYLVS